MPANFYSLRHSAGILAEEGGATLREVMALTRHSDPKLTLRTYGRLRLEHLGTVAAKLPLLVSGMVKNIPVHGQKHGRAADEDRRLGKMSEELPAVGTSVEVLESRGVEANRGDLRAAEGSSPGRIRTYDPPVNRREGERPCPAPRTLNS